jgi:hypothetical protein
MKAQYHTHKTVMFHTQQTVLGILFHITVLKGLGFCVHPTFASLNKWIKTNICTLNLDKTNIIKFCTNNRTCVNQNVGYNDKTTEEVETTNFLGIQIDKT